MLVFKFFFNKGFIHISGERQWHFNVQSYTSLVEAFVQQKQLKQPTSFKELVKVIFSQLAVLKVHSY